MKDTRHLLLSLLIALPVGLAACDDVAVEGEIAEPPPEEVFGPSFRGWGFGTSGTRMNTNVLNGSGVNTVRFYYSTSYGETIDNIWVPGFGWLDGDMTTVQVVDGALQAEKNGQFIQAHAFEGSWWFLSAGGQATYMILQDVRHAGEVGLSNYGAKSMTNLHPDRLVYKWSSPDAPAQGTLVDPKTGWGGSYDGIHTCAEDGSGDVWSVMSRGLLINEAAGDVSDAYWAPNQYAYIACLSGAAGKTMMWGYSHDNPDGGLPNVSLPEYEAALRVTRADYCGDGTSYTKPGEQVTFRDQWGINVHSSDAVGDEAVFGPQGALCVETPRWEYYEGDPIQCGDGTTIPSCTTFSHCVGYPYWICYYDYAEDVYDEDPDSLIWTQNAAF